MTMPRLSGKQTLAKLLEINPRVKVILASGYTAEGTPEEFIRSGAADFINKPYASEKLAASIRSVLGK
jgi:FixJ family two-component response regulator